VATAINKRLQDKLGRHDLADDKLLQEAFSDKPAQSGKPRLRIPGDPRNPTVASLQRGAPQFGTGRFWVIRNPATRETADWPPQEALEQLAALSVLARLIDMCEVATHQATAPSVWGALGAWGAPAVWCGFLEVPGFRQEVALPVPGRAWGPLDHPRPRPQGVGRRPPPFPPLDAYQLA
jgi:hypothetical protein